MPNWVYNSILVEEKYANKTKEISSKGIARYYRPMPDDLEGTTSPQRIPETISQEKHDELMNKYGFTDWWGWANKYWGTKWGCCDNSFDGHQYSYSTAWSPLRSELLSQFAKDIPNFTYIWEEEQGFGQKWEYVDGEATLVKEWDIPKWGEWDDGIVELKEDYENIDGKYKKGFYAEYNLEEFLGETKEKAKKEYETV